MIRFIPFVPLLLVLACSDYKLDEHVVNDTAVVTNDSQDVPLDSGADTDTGTLDTGVDSGVIPDDTAGEDTATEDSAEDSAEDSGKDTAEDVVTDCGNVYSDHNLYGTVVSTGSFPQSVITTPADTSTLLKQGDPLIIQVQFSTQDGCGSYNLRELVWSMNDYSSGATWIDDSWMAMPASELSELTTSTTFPAARANGVTLGMDADWNVTDGGTQWIWRTPESTWANGKLIVSQVIGSVPRTYQFVWNGSGSAPVGEELVFTLSFGWDDSSTGSRMAPNSADREIIVTITE